MNLFSPAEFISNYSAVGENKAQAPLSKLFLLGILAGLFICLGGAATSTANQAIENVGLMRMVSGLLFPFGLIMVVFTGAELFTGNCLIAISVLEKRISIAGMLRNLVVVYLGNFIGAMLLAAAFCSQLNNSTSMLAVMAIRSAAGKCAMTFPKAFILGVFCNILVCAAVMMAQCAKDTAGRAMGAYVPVCIFVICGFEHCVANMFYVPVGLFALSVHQYAELAAAADIKTTALTWGNFLLNNLLPVTLGNIAGGVGFATLIWWCNREHKTKSEAQ